jgi:hypothetical protein
VLGGFQFDPDLLELGIFYLDINFIEGKSQCYPHHHGENDEGSEPVFLGGIDVSHSQWLQVFQIGGQYNGKACSLMYPVAPEQKSVRRIVRF